MLLIKLNKVSFLQSFKGLRSGSLDLEALLLGLSSSFGGVDIREILDSHLFVVWKFEKSR